MPIRLSIVEARRRLGPLAEQVRRTGHAVVLTRRGRPVARLAPDVPAPARPPARHYDALGTLRGTVASGRFADLRRAVGALRREFARDLDRRAERWLGRSRG